MERNTLTYSDGIETGKMIAATQQAQSLGEQNLSTAAVVVQPTSQAQMNMQQAAPTTEVQIDIVPVSGTLPDPEKIGGLYFFRVLDIYIQEIGPKDCSDTSATWVSEPLIDGKRGFFIPFVGYSFIIIAYDDGINWSYSLANTTLESKYTLTYINGSDSQEIWVCDSRVHTKYIE